jgi:hypothetical protein
MIVHIPHNQYSYETRALAYGGIFLATLGMVFGTLGLATCKAFVFDQDPSDGVSQVFVGLYGYQTTAVAVTDEYIWVSDVCVSYNSLTTVDGSAFPYEMDGTAEALQKMGYSIAAIGGIFLILSCCAPCFSGPLARMWKCIGAVIILCGILQGITLMMQNSSICTNNPIMQFLEVYSTAFYNTLENTDSCAWVGGLGRTGAGGGQLEMTLCCQLDKIYYYCAAR